MMSEVTLQDVYTLQIRRQSNQSNPSPYCEACKNGFVHVNSIQVRQFTQTGKLPGVCKSCNNSFLKICRLQIRHLTHSESHTHVCPKCNKSFTHAGNIKKHMLLHEQKDAQSEVVAKTEDGQASAEDGPPKPPSAKEGRPKPPYECPECGRVFIKHGSFLKHCNKHEAVTLDLGNIRKPVVPSEPIRGENVKVSEEKFPCEQCNRIFSRQTYLIKHCMQEHEPEYPCPVCDKTFKSKPLLSSHMRSHKHVCKLCKKSFTEPEDLELHLQNHVMEQTQSTQEQTENWKEAQNISL